MGCSLQPSTSANSVVLPVTGAVDNVVCLPFGIYSEIGSSLYSAHFISGAVDQVAFVYKKLGGDILNVELSECQVYAAYEEAVLEYSYLVNIHQSKNSLGSMLGNTTGTFDQDGQMRDGESLKDQGIALKYPRFEFSYGKRVTNTQMLDTGLGGTKQVYSASFEIDTESQDYDLQQIVSASATQSGIEFSGSVGNKRIAITRVYYKTPHAMWRFYGYYGGLNAVGNLHSYGQYADDSTFEIIPTWQNKAQAMAYEDAIHTRNSHYSYEIRNNKLRIYPTPYRMSPANFWFEFYIENQDVWEEDSDKETGISGINNMNTLPFENIPFININSIGKQWIRRFALALCKEMLGLVRRKISTIPIPGESVTLDGPELVTQSKEEQEKLRDELKEVLDELTYPKIAETTAEVSENTKRYGENVPMPIFAL